MLMLLLFENDNNNFVFVSQVFPPFFSEMLSAPVKRIDEILSSSHSPEDFKDQEVPLSDNDSWLYGGEEELKSVLEERQREMENYEQRQKRKQKGKDKVNDDDSSNQNKNDFDLGDVAKSMKSFVQKVSSYQGAEVPEDRFYILLNYL